MTTQIAEYSQTDAALAELKARLANVVYDVATTKGMDAAKKGRAEVRGLRTALEAKRKEIKATALERCRLIDEEAKRITTELLALEEPIDAQIKAEEKRKEEEKEAKRRAEAERMAALQKRVDSIKSMPLNLMGKPPESIQQAISDAEHIEIDDSFGDLFGAAMEARGETIARLREMHAAAVAQEAEAARLSEQRAELARQEKEAADRREAERKAQEAETARIRAEQEEAAAKLRAEREAFEREQAEARRKAEEARQQEEAARQAQPVTATAITIEAPAAQIILQPGEHYAGLMLDADGQPSHHLIDTGIEVEEPAWQDAKDWAANQGLELPTRREQSLLFANCRQHFASAWYWSAEKHESDTGWAWYQYFGDGNQGYGHPDGRLRARYVRRLPI